MKVQTVVRTSGRVIEKGVNLIGDVPLIDVLEKIDELEEVIRDIKYGRTLVAHEDANIFADTPLQELIEDFEPRLLEEGKESFEIVEPFTDEEYDYKLMLGLFSNKASGL